MDFYSERWYFQKEDWNWKIQDGLRINELFFIFWMYLPPKWPVGLRLEWVRSSEFQFDLSLEPPLY